MAKWVDVDKVQIFDLPNGFLLIRCASDIVMQWLLLEVSWSINGIILQLSSWQPFFELAYAKLNTVATWVQLHNLLVDF